MISSANENDSKQDQIDINVLIIQSKKLLEKWLDFLEKYNDALSKKKEEPMVSRDQQLINKVRRILLDHISDPSFNIEKMSEEMGTNRTTLRRNIKAITGMNVSDFLREIKLEKAALLLKNQTGLITEICSSVGFKDSSYFTKMFKKKYGILPSNYFKSKINQEGIDALPDVSKTPLQ